MKTEEVVDSIWSFLSNTGERKIVINREFLNHFNYRVSCEGVLNSLGETELHIDNKKINGERGLVVAKAEEHGLPKIRDGVIYKEFKIADFTKVCSCPTHEHELTEKYIFKNWNDAKFAWRLLASNGQIVYADRGYRIRKSIFPAKDYLPDILVKSPEKEEELIILPNGEKIISDKILKDDDINSLKERGIISEYKRNEYSQDTVGYLYNIILKELGLS